jgi:hypothetical protein
VKSNGCGGQQNNEKRLPHAKGAGPPVYRLRITSYESGLAGMKPHA